MDNSYANSPLPQDTTTTAGAHSRQEDFPSLGNSRESFSTSFLTDPIELGNRRTLQDLVLEEAKHIPEVRQDRIKQIQTILNSGQYHISSDLLAERILQDFLLNESSPQN